MIKYRVIKINRVNAPIIADLVCRTYQTFNKNEGDKKSIKAFLSQFDNSSCSADDLIKKFKKSTINFGAFSGTKIIGIIRGNKNRITNLFIDGKFHHQGIGKRLIELFESHAKKEGSKFIKVRSSIYATNFYLRSGYKKTTGIRLYHGLKIQPLEKKIK
ncbi:MAG: GNAT family N-acetyltransferase [Patescibacteria group bacterium]|jgi:histone acetyltransferase (RNA polymerase elongator complex component)